MANTQIKNIGDRAQPQWTFTVADVPTDPTQIVVLQQDADGVETTLTTASNPSTLTTASTPLARMSAGVFKLSPGASLTEQGYWLFRAVSTGTAEAGPPDFVYKVGPSEFVDGAGLAGHALIGLQEAKDWLNQNNIETGEELELVRVINDVSQRIIEQSERELIRYDSTASATARSFDFTSWPATCVGDLTSYTQVRFLNRDGTAVVTVAAGDIVDLPRNRRPWEPITHLRFTADVVRPDPDWALEVTGVWGFPSVPGTVRQAVLDSVAWVLDRDVEHYSADLGPQTGGAGQNIIVFGSRPQILSLPPPAEAVVRDLQLALVG